VWTVGFRLATTRVESVTVPLRILRHVTGDALVAVSKSCVMCGSPLPDSHKHATCSMCYGDVDYGTDGYYRRWLEAGDEVAEEREREENGG